LSLVGHPNFIACEFFAGFFVSYSSLVIYLSLKKTLIKKKKRFSA